MARPSRPSASRSADKGSARALAQVFVSVSFSVSFSFSFSSSTRPDPARAGAEQAGRLRATLPHSAAPRPARVARGHRSARAGAPGAHAGVPGWPDRHQRCRDGGHAAQPCHAPGPGRLLQRAARAAAGVQDRQPCRVVAPWDARAGQPGELQLQRGGWSTRKQVPASGTCCLNERVLGDGSTRGAPVARP